MFVRDDLIYIAVAIDRHPTAGQRMISGIRIVDDLMLKRAVRQTP
ncbi:hypothetical protein N9H39_05130 [Gammaproteobacteria bacterium]|nr:hypothetical protein [Gammaproteobacteria bacterium]